MCKNFLVGPKREKSKYLKMNKSKKDLYLLKIFIYFLHNFSSLQFFSENF